MDAVNAIKAADASGPAGARQAGPTETLTPNAISDLVDAVPRNGCSPDTISCSITHRDQTSSASSPGRPDSTSGDR